MNDREEAAYKEGYKTGFAAGQASAKKATE
jgi:hypothetical protein